jgi:hypothetical protein
MGMRSILILLGGTAVAVAAAACSTPSSGGPAASSTVTVTASATPTTVTATTSTTVPATASPADNKSCDLLRPDIAKRFAGDDAQRKLSYEGDPPVPVGDSACYYDGSKGSVGLTVLSGPSDSMKHFNVIRPDNRDATLPYEAYWFGPGVSLVVVKDGQVLDFKFAPKPDDGNLTPETRAADVELANQIVPEVG